MANIRCSDPQHATRSAMPGWSDGTLATSDNADMRLLCEACARVRIAQLRADEDSEAAAEAIAVTSLLAKLAGVSSADLRRAVRRLLRD